MTRFYNDANNCHIVETGNDSYRFQHSTVAAKSRIKSREHKRKDGKEARKNETTDEPF